MRKLDKLKKDIAEMKPRGKFPLSFDHLSDEEIGKVLKEYQTDPRPHYERTLFDHSDWTDEEIYQKMDDDLITLYEEWSPTEKEIREMRQHLKGEWPDRPKKSEYTEKMGIPQE